MTARSAAGVGVGGLLWTARIRERTETALMGRLRACRHGQKGRVRLQGLPASHCLLTLLRRERFGSLAGVWLRAGGTGLGTACGRACEVRHVGQPGRGARVM
jgi:hypothetical protein